MRILLCEKSTGLFLRPEGWTSERSRAQSFGSSPEAIIYARQHNLKDVEVLWDFDDEEYNVRLPIAA